MVWIKTSNEYERSFKHDWMDDIIYWTESQSANVPEDVAERLVEERDDIDYTESVRERFEDVSEELSDENNTDADERDTDDTGDAETGADE